MAIISLGELKAKNLLPIIIGCFFCFFNRVVNNYEGTTLFDDHFIIVNIITALSKLLTIIPYLILKFRSKKIRNFSIENKIVNNFQVNYLYTKIEKPKGKWEFIFLSSIIFFVQFLMFISTVKMKANYWVWDMLFALLLCHIIFKIQFYKHHYFSLIIILLTGLIIDLVFENIQNDVNNNLFKIFIRFIREILLILHEVVDKYIMEKKYGSVYEISLFNGIINTILFVFFSLLNYYWLKLDDFGEYFNHFEKTDILVIIGLIITHLGFYWCELLANKNNTPCHVFIIFVFGQLAFFLDFSLKSTIIFFSFIFVLFMTLIFNEIIELNFWGLSFNVKRNITYRAENEDLEISELYKIDVNDDNYTIELNGRGHKDINDDDIY